MSSLQEHLNQYGLQLQTEKTRIWGSSMVRAAPETAAKLQEANIQLSALCNGLTVCGNALGDEAETELPLGDDHYVTKWLNDKATDLSHKLQRLYSLVLLDTNELPLIQVALLILRATWPGAVTHIFRALPVSLSRPWAETIQPLFDDCFANITNTTHLDSQRKQLRSLPLNKGGLGLPDLSDLALTARLAALASIPEHAQATHYKTTCINQEAMELATRIEDATGAPTQPIIGTVHQLPEGRSHKGLQQKLSNLFHLAHAKNLRLALSDSHPVMQAWRFHTTTEQPGAPPLHPGQASWLQASPRPATTTPGEHAVRAASPRTAPQSSERHPAKARGKPRHSVRRPRSPRSAKTSISRLRSWEGSRAPPKPQLPLRAPWTLAPKRSWTSSRTRTTMHSAKSSRTANH